MNIQIPFDSADWITVWLFRGSVAFTRISFFCFPSSVSLPPSLFPKCCFFFFLSLQRFCRNALWKSHATSFTLMSRSSSSSVRPQYSFEVVEVHLYPWLESNESPLHTAQKAMEISFKSSLAVAKICEIKEPKQSEFEAAVDEAVNCSEICRGAMDKASRSNTKYSIRVRFKNLCGAPERPGSATLICGCMHSNAKKLRKRSHICLPIHKTTLHKSNGAAHSSSFFSQFLPPPRSISP